MIPFLLICFAVPALFYFGFLLQVLFGLRKATKPNKKNDKKVFVSVIVPFRNESEVILNCLESLEAQTYPSNLYEIIFVDDFSSDDSAQKLQAAKNLALTKIISVPNESQIISPKKRGITFGIENSSGEIILTTDADCVHPAEWIAEMISCFDEHTGFVSGSVKFANSQKVFGKIQQLEFGGLVLTGGGLINSNKPIICNAANIAFRKQAFSFVNGYEGNQQLASGDDEFLMQKIAKSKKYSVKFLYSEHSVVETTANETTEKFIQQRKRWASKGLFYNDKTLVLKLIVIYLFFLSFPIQLMIGAVVSTVFLYSFALLFLLKGMFEYLILRNGIPFLYPALEVRIFIFSEIVHIPYIIFAGFAGAIGNFEWKGRALKR